MGTGKIGAAFTSTATVFGGEAEAGSVVLIAYRPAIVVAYPVVFAASVAPEGLSRFQCAAVW